MVRGGAFFSELKAEIREGQVEVCQALASTRKTLLEDNGHGRRLQPNGLRELCEKHQVGPGGQFAMLSNGWMLNLDPEENRGNILAGICRTRPAVTRRPTVPSGVLSVRLARDNPPPSGGRPNPWPRTSVSIPEHALVDREEEEGGRSAPAGCRRSGRESRATGPTASRRMPLSQVVGADFTRAPKN